MAPVATPAQLPPLSCGLRHADADIGALVNGGTLAIELAGQDGFDLLEMVAGRATLDDGLVIKPTHR